MQGKFVFNVTVYVTVNKKTNTIIEIFVTQAPYYLKINVFFIIGILTNDYVLLLQGDSFWEALEVKLGSFIPPSLKKVLTFMGYNSNVALKKFDAKVHIPKIEKFMQEKLFKLVPESDLESYYGNFKSAPKEYELMGGFELVLEGLSEYVKRTEGKGRALSSISETKQRPPQEQRDVQPSIQQSDQILIKEQTHLSKTIGKWINDNYSHIMDPCDDVAVVVSRDGLGTLTAKIVCPEENCSKETTATKTGSRWCHNFYRHCKMCHSVTKPNCQPNICDMLNNPAKNSRANDKESTASTSDEQSQAKDQDTSSENQEQNFLEK